MKLLNIISSRTNLLTKLDPERIYAEEVRNFFNIPYRLAILCCDMAVKQNYFEKKVGVLCPHCQRITLVVKRSSDIPEEVECEVCRELEVENYIFRPGGNDLIEFYKLTKQKKHD